MNYKIWNDLDMISTKQELYGKKLEDRDILGSFSEKLSRHAS